MLVKSFVSNLIIDLSSNLDKYIQFNVYKFFEVACFYIKIL